MKHAPQCLLALGIALMLFWGHAIPVGADDGHALFARPAVDDAALQELRGGADTKLNQILANGTVSEVHASDLVTGHNIVTDGALAGASGMPMFIQNSGNGVLIQNAVIVNVEVQ